ncbi:hypothetical protein ACP8HI_03810 [Paenibacillus sp. FA6]|uniref:hypothetical protein n=1 Tax=Paenibacillus sp. FA6 TaxID=3413029 RepID=UPI003F659350
MSFTERGIPVDAVESRTATICMNASNESRVVIAARGFLLIVDVETEHCTQLSFPNGHFEYPYDCFSSGNGMFYMGVGNMFYVVDPFHLTYVDAIQISNRDELCGFSYAENNEGHIYVASYPDSHLYRYRPVERDLVDYGSMDSEQKYPSHMAVDAYGWVYLGLGTTKKNIVAFDPHSGERRTLLKEELRTIGLGQVRQAIDNQAYALIGEQWVRVEQGIVIERMLDNQIPDSFYTGTSFDKFHRQLQGEWKLLSHSLSNHELALKHTETAIVKVIQLAYKSTGAMLSTFVTGPDKCIYGTSMHPLHFYSYDQQQLTNWGPQVIQHGFGGNIAAYAVQGNVLVGASYPEGRLHLYDVTRPIQLDETVEQMSLLSAGQTHVRNPVCVTSHIEIHRPRCAVALRDHEHVVYGGFPGYGMVGGGLCVYHLSSGAEWLIPHTEIIAEQSTVSLAETAEGILIGGTSIETPGGAEPKAHSAYLYTLDLTCRTVTKRLMIHEGIREYSLLLIDPNGWIHSITSCSKYVVWDPHREVLVREVDLSAWGKVVREGWELCEEDQCIYGVMGNAVFRITLSSLQPECIAVPHEEITAGFAKLNNELYFGISTHLWSYSI